MEVYILLIIIGLAVGYFIGYFISSKRSKEKIDFYKDKSDKEQENFVTIKDEFEKIFKGLASDVVKSNSEEFLKLATEKFNNLSQGQKADLKDNCAQPHSE